MILDVRDVDEIKQEGRVKHDLNIPLSGLETNLEVLLKITKHETLELLCRSGSRAAIAKEKIENASKEPISVKVIEGGLKGVNSGNIIKGNAKTKISIMRQVMIIAGLMIATFSVIGTFINPLFHWAPTIIGTALFLADLSGICPMAIVLGKTP